MENISFGQALGYCFGTLSYIFWLLIGAGVLAAAIYVTLKKYRKEGTWYTGYTVALFVAVAIFFFTLPMRPAEIAANTTKEQFKRGVVIGY
jgi:cell division protein FtsW (lipid II flippase)